MRYVSESEDSQRQVASKIGVSCIDLSQFFAGKAQPHKQTLAQVELAKIGLESHRPIYLISEARRCQSFPGWFASDAL